MKVLYLCHIANNYGANRSLLELILELRVLGVEPLVVLPKEDTFCDPLSQNGIAFTTSEVSWWVDPVPAMNRYREFSEMSSSDISDELVNIAKEFNPQLIHTNTSVTPDGYLLSQAVGCPHVWHIREMVEADYDLTFSLGAQRSRDIIRMGSECICNSHATKHAHFGSTDSGNVHVIYNPISGKPALPRKKRSSTPILLSIGHMSRFKGHHEAIEAVASLKDEGVQTHLKIAGGGTGEYKTFCEELVSKLSLEPDVTFLGHVPSPWELLSEASLLLQCSTNEAFGRVTVEAMLAHCPVVAKESGGTPEIIKDQETGFLYSENKKLSSLIKELLANENLDTIRSSAHHKAVAQYAPQTIASQVYERYKAAVKTASQ